MPILNGGGGQSSPSLIEYNFSEGKEISLTEIPQRVIEAAPPQTQRSFWVYFSKPAFLAGKEDMVGAIEVPARGCFEWSDFGGVASDWWAVSPNGGKAFVQIKMKGTEKGEPLEPVSIFEYTQGQIFTSENKTFLRYTGTKETEIISISNQVINYSNSDIPIDYDYVTCMIAESSSNPEEAGWNHENIQIIKGGEAISFTWNCKNFPYLSGTFNEGEWMAFAVLNFSGSSVSFSEYLEY